MRRWLCWRYLVNSVGIFCMVPVPRVRCSALDDCVGRGWSSSGTTVSACKLPVRCIIRERSGKRFAPQRGFRRGFRVDLVVGTEPLLASRLPEGLCNAMQSEPSNQVIVGTWLQAEISGQDPSASQPRQECKLNLLFTSWVNNPSSLSGHEQGCVLADASHLRLLCSLVALDDCGTNSERLRELPWQRRCSELGMEASRHGLSQYGLDDK